MEAGEAIGVGPLLDVQRVGLSLSQPLDVCLFANAARIAVVAEEEVDTRVLEGFWHGGAVPLALDKDRSWAIGSLGIFVLIFLASVLVTAAANDPEHSVALAVVGGGLTGLGAGILGGWLPGLILFAILGTRENVRRAVGVVLDEFREYWEARTEAMHAIPQGRDPRVVSAFLASYRLPLDDY